MSTPSLVEFQFERMTLVVRPLRHCKKLLQRVGNYFQETLGSDLDSSYILETEKFLNDIYIKTTKENVNPILQEMLTKAGSYASTLSYGLKKNIIDDNFFFRAKQLGTLLIAISRSIPDE